jgi:hypothetical protein
LLAVGDHFGSTSRTSWFLIQSQAIYRRCLFDLVASYCATP